MKQLIISVMVVVLITVFLPISSRGQDIPDPPPDIADKVDWIWDHVIKSTVTSGRGSFNTFFDVLHANAALGKFQVCVRWDSDQPVSKDKSIEIENMIARHMGQWTSQLKGYDGWPWDTVYVKVSGWAVRDRSTLEWTDAEAKTPIYINDIFENAPQCAQNCGRFFHYDKTYTYPNCPGGAQNHYDFSSWHSKVMDGMGFGSDWGQRTVSTTTLNNTTGHLHIILHEMGHGYYLPDFYDFTIPGGNPACVMNAGSASNITPFDTWMLRRVYSELKRMPGRLPEITVATTSTTSVPRGNRFTAYSRQGQVKVKAVNALDHEIQVVAYNLKGKRMMSATMPKGMSGEFSLGCTRSLSRGIYLVKITGINLNEVHRINILD